MRRPAGARVCRGTVSHRASQPLVVCGAVQAVQYGTARGGVWGGTVHAVQYGTNGARSLHRRAAAASQETAAWDGWARRSDKRWRRLATNQGKARSDMKEGGWSPCHEIQGSPVKVLRSLKHADPNAPGLRLARWEAGRRCPPVSLCLPFELPGRPSSERIECRQTDRMQANSDMNRRRACCAHTDRE